MGRGTSQRGATLTAVAARARVSRMTVSNALNNPTRLSQTTLERVLAAVDELGYRPNHAARTLRTRSTRLIGCRLMSVAPSATGGVTDRFMHSLCTAARAGSYDVLAFAVDDEQAEIATFHELVRRTAVDGFVLTQTHAHDGRADWLLAHRSQFVAFGRPWDAEHGDHSWVDIDGADGTRQCVEHLVAQGASKIGFLGWPKGDGVGDDRLRGWRDAVREHGLTLQGMTARGVESISTGAELAPLLLDRGVDAIVCVSDLVAVGAVRSLTERGVGVGDDVLVTGFDDSPAAEVAIPRLTSVRQPLEEAARRIVTILAGHLDGSLTEPVTELLRPSLVVRASTLSTGRARPPMKGRT